MRILNVDRRAERKRERFISNYGSNMLKKIVIDRMVNDHSIKKTYCTKKEENNSKIYVQILIFGRQRIAFPEILATIYATPNLKQHIFGTNIFLENLVYFARLKLLNHFSKVFAIIKLSTGYGE